MKELLRKNYYIGVMSGTSLDGIDLVFCEITAHNCQLLHAYEYPFPLALKEEILSTIQEKTTLQNIGILDHKIGLLYAESIIKFLQKFDLKRDSIVAIGLHGQTVWHEPHSKFPFSMQLGDANIVTARTGITTVADFRRMDMANGGQGAPFAPAFHRFLFDSLGENTAILNIGGMANITLLDEKLQGWDSGCGNVLLDSWMMRTQHKFYDNNGKFAKSGKLNESLLKAMLKDDYFSKFPPKSTGREYFNDTWLANYLSTFGTIPDADVQRTLLELTAQSIANDLNTTKTETTIVCGGGVKNNFLIQRLQKLSKSQIVISDTLGVSSDFLEAMAFAWFADKRVHNETVDLCSVTGASKASLLGGIYG